MIVCILSNITCLFLTSTEEEHSQIFMSKRLQDNKLLKSTVTKFPHKVSKAKVQSLVSSNSLHLNAGMISQIKSQQT
jgi:hypothetical protein